MGARCACFKSRVDLDSSQPYIDEPMRRPRGLSPNVFAVPTTQPSVKLVLGKNRKEEDFVLEYVLHFLATENIGKIIGQSKKLPYDSFVYKNIIKLKRPHSRQSSFDQDYPKYIFRTEEEMSQVLDKLNTSFEIKRELERIRLRFNQGNDRQVDVLKMIFRSNGLECIDIIIINTVAESEDSDIEML